MATQAIKQLESLGSSKPLPALLKPIQKDQKICQKGLTMLLNSEYPGDEQNYELSYLPRTIGSSTFC